MMNLPSWASKKEERLWDLTYEAKNNKQHDEDFIRYCLNEIWDYQHSIWQQTKMLNSCERELQGLLGRITEKRKIKETPKRGRKLILNLSVHEEGSIKCKKAYRRVQMAFDGEFPSYKENSRIVRTLSR